MIYDLAGKRVWVAGHRGMVGAALIRRLGAEKCEIVTTEGRAADFRRQEAVEEFLDVERPAVVVVAAAKVGGILANDTYPAEFLYDNLMIAANIVEAACKAGVEKLLFLGSSCIYPRMAPQPISEDALLTGPLEPTNEWYAIAKIAGIKLCQAYRRQYGRDFIAAMPTNFYGPGDNFDLQRSHVLPALIRKAHEAKLHGEDSFVVWGTGAPRREFMHVDDCADALVYLLKNYSAAEHVNVGSGTDVTIKDLARMVGRIVGYSGEIVFDTSKPDGAPRKLMDSSRLHALGWSPRIDLEKGISETYQFYLHAGSVRSA